MRKPFSKFLLTILLAGIAVCLAIISVPREKRWSAVSDQGYLNLLREAHSAVTKGYVEKPDGKRLVRGMVDGMLASLDPHNAYLPPEPYQEMEVQMAGAFGGVGIELGMKDGRLTVIAPIDDTPAFRAGIQPNDHIWKIDGTPTHGMNISAAVKRMRGGKGSPVTLTILRGAPPRQLTIRLIRAIIKIKSIKAHTLEPGYAMIRISQFQERTGGEFRQALQDLRTRSGGVLKGLVIDLRFNPGGLLGSAVEVVNCFIGDDADSTLIVSTRGRLPDANQAFHASLGNKEPRYPIVVLINGGSASASEIVAGALQDHRRALVMGKQSFGKGSVQSLFPLPGDAALKLTTARYYTPSGRSIQARGITPDIEVGNVAPVETNGMRDERIRERDLENRLAPREREPVVKEPPEPPHGGRGEPDLARDYQLGRALELLRSLSRLREQGLAPLP
ncbi:MAG: S41 family peptidase [Deltaproteobacteria bacterium]|nr:S41 family peptidase [Deltaproteobacteria bacterium]